MLLRPNTYTPLILINLFFALNLFSQSNISNKTSNLTAKPCHKDRPKKNVEHKVIEVENESKLKELLSNNKMVVVEFYGPECGACTMFKRKYEALSKKHPEITFVKINGKKQADLVHKYHIKAFPSFIFIFNNGNPIKTVVGPHKASVEKGIQELINVANTPIPVKSPTINPNNQAAANALIKELTTLAELDALILGSDKLVVVDYHAERWCGPCKYFGPLFSELANEHSDVATFVKINTDLDKDQAVAKKYKVTSFPTTLIFKDQKSDQAATVISGANKAGVKQAILQAAPAKNIASPKALNTNTSTNN